MAAATPEIEIMGWALDQSSVQSLFPVLENKWGLDRNKAFELIMNMARKNYFIFYETLPDNAGDPRLSDSFESNHIEIPLSVITLDYLAGRYYTWMCRTDITFSVIKDMNLKLPQKRD